MTEDKPAYSVTLCTIATQVYAEHQKRHDIYVSMAQKQPRTVSWKVCTSYAHGDA